MRFGFRRLQNIGNFAPTAGFELWFSRTTIHFYGCYFQNFRACGGLQTIIFKKKNWFLRVEFSKFSRLRRAINILNFADFDRILGIKLEPQSGSCRLSKHFVHICGRARQHFERSLLFMLSDVIRITLYCGEFFRGFLSFFMLSRH